MRYLSLLLFLCISAPSFAQYYEVSYEKDGFKGHIQFEIVKGNYIFSDGFSYKIKDNVKNVIASYKNGQYDDVLRAAGITFPVTLNVSEANNTAIVTGNAFFYRSPQKSSQHSSQPSVRLSLYDPFPAIPDFSDDAKKYAVNYAKEQGVNLWQTTGGLKNLEVTFVMLLDLKHQVEAAIKKDESAKEAEKAKVAAEERRKQDSITTNSSSWMSLEEQQEATEQERNHRSTAGNAQSSAAGESRSRSGSRTTTTEDNTMSWEEQQALAQRLSEIRRQEQADIEKALEPMGETIAMVDELVPEATMTWADFYLGADDAGGLSAWRLGIESRMYHGDKFIIYFGFAGMLATQFDYYFVDDEDAFRKAMYTSSSIGLELQLGFGSRILGEDENSEDAGSALYWGLLGYIGGIDGGDLEKPDDYSGFNVMGFYGPRLLLGYRFSHVSLRASYSLCITDKRYFMGLSHAPGLEDNNTSGLLQIQLGYSW